jgi:hypothetical protein
VAGATFVGSIEDGKGRIFEMANTKNKKIKFQVELFQGQDYVYTISVIKPPTDN